MNYIIKLSKIIILISFTFNALSDEIQIQSTDMDIKNDGNLIIANNAEITVSLEKIKILSKIANYEKTTNLLTFKENVIFNDEKNEIVIEGNLIKYEKNKDLIYSEGKTKLKIENEYKVNSNNIYYDRSSSIIYSSEETLIEDSDNNFYILKDGFKFEIVNEIIKSKKSIIIDKNNNKYVFENLILNLKINEIVGKELEVQFEKSYFGNKDNDPLLKGRSSYSNEDELKVYKAVFSTCNVENKSCRGWELNSDEFKHDKVKKIFEYKNTWLKIFDYKVLFTPYFNHPDPSVKRKSGFLAPSYSTSESLGIAFNVPYFKVLSKDKDITFNPRLYADKSFLLQNEYRQALKNSEVISDFSFLIGEAGTKGHFFYNQVGNINENLNFELNLQGVEGDNYLKNHKLIDTSNLISDDNLLVSNLDLNWTFTDSNLNTSVRVFEDLSRSHNDRFQYIFPSFNFSKKIKIPESYNGKFMFNSYGYNKHYDTNTYESVITNDFLFSSNQYVNKKGLVSNYNIFLKNPSSYSSNSSNFKENESYDLFTTLKLDSSLPLSKQVKSYTHFLRPKVSLRYSPNGNSNISSKDVLLNYDNVFSLNRIGVSDQVEGGDSLSMGLEFKRIDEDGSDIIDFKIANVLKSKENIKLPTKSKLNKTRSDLFGSIGYNLNNNLKIGYDFSYDRDLDHSNLNGLNVDFNLNNIFTNFYYYSTDNDLGLSETISNSTIINFNDENSLEFNTTKDLIDDFTEYNNLIYSYVTDCISINLNYNKSYYRDGNLKPNESLSFLVKIIPFTELGVPNLQTFINKK